MKPETKIFLGWSVAWAGLDAAFSSVCLLADESGEASLIVALITAGAYALQIPYVWWSLWGKKPPHEPPHSPASVMSDQMDDMITEELPPPLPTVITIGVPRTPEPPSDDDTSETDPAAGVGTSFNRETRSSSGTSSGDPSFSSSYDEELQEIVVDNGKHERRYTPR